jgi:hypothetical protein
MRKRSRSEKSDGRDKGRRRPRADKLSASRRVAEIRGAPPGQLRRTTLDMDPEFESRPAPPTELTRCGS